MKVWVTKYALTTGILEMDGKISRDRPEMFVPETSHGAFQTYYHKPFWHESHEAAVDHAEKLRLAKLKSLENALLKLSNLKFISQK